MKENIFFCICCVVFFWGWSPLQAREKTFTIVIDAGHGGKDPGARGTIINEKNINLSVALKLGRLITNSCADVKVVYTRKSDIFVDLDERANIANRNKADLFISIHANSVKKKGSSVRGTETYTLGLARSEENLEVAMRENSAILLEDNYLQKYEGFDPKSSESYIIFEFMQNKHVEQSVELASYVQKAFSTEKRTNRGVRQSGFLVLRKTSMPSILVELGYISNREEERFMKSTAGQDKLSKALYAAFIKYKRMYDRKLGITSPVNDKGNVSYGSDGETVESARPNKPAGRDASSKGKVLYKVQFLTSGKKLPAGSRLFKGYKDVGYYVENGIYKYTYGETTSFNSIKVTRRQVAKDFKDAFIVAFKNGKKVKY